MRREDKWILKSLLAVPLPEGLAVSQTALGLSPGEVPWLSSSPSLEPLEGSLPRTREGKPITVSLFPLGSIPWSPRTLSDLLQRQETWVRTGPSVGPEQASGAFGGLSIDHK